MSCWEAIRAPLPGPAWVLEMAPLPHVWPGPLRIAHLFHRQPKWTTGCSLCGQPCSAQSNYATFRTSTAKHNTVFGFSTGTVGTERGSSGYYLLEVVPHEDNSQIDLPRYPRYPQYPVDIIMRKDIASRPTPRNRNAECSPWACLGSTWSSWGWSSE